MKDLRVYTLYLLPFIQNLLSYVFKKKREEIIIQSDVNISKKRNEQDMK